MLNDSKTVGLLLVGHGTRDEVGTRQFLELAEGLKEAFRPLAVEEAFLELAQPGIEAGVKRLLDRGVNEIVTVPVILFAAGHVKRDIPSQVGAAVAARGRADVKQVQVGHLGCHTALVELSRLRMEEAERGGDSGYDDTRGGLGNEHEEAVSRGGAGARRGREKKTVDGGTYLLLVARGSKDEEAAAEMRRLAALRQAENANVYVEIAFLAMAEPSLDQQLAKLSALLDKPAVAPKGTESGFAPGCRRVIVQPHFLFEGELVDRIRGQIAEIAAAHPETEWIVSHPLADQPGNPGLASELLQKVILDRCQEGGIRVVVSAGDD